MLRTSDVIAFAAATDLDWAREFYAGSEACTGLRARGVGFNRYEGMDQDDNGVWTTPAGDRIAWFTDPDGNTLSVTQFA